MLFGTIACAAWRVTLAACSRAATECWLKQCQARQNRGEFLDECTKADVMLRASVALSSGGAAHARCLGMVWYCLTACQRLPLRRIPHPSCCTCAHCSKMSANEEETHVPYSRAYAALQFVLYVTWSCLMWCWAGLKGLGPSLPPTSDGKVRSSKGHARSLSTLPPAPSIPSSLHTTPRVSSPPHWHLSDRRCRAAEQRRHSLVLPPTRLPRIRRARSTCRPPYMAHAQTYHRNSHHHRPNHPLQRQLNFLNRP